MAVSALSNPRLIVETQQNQNVDDAQSAANAEATRDQSVEFLEILLIQLQNQNPLEPTDTNELTNQLIQQSQLEQQIQTNEKLDDFLKTFEENNGLASLGYIGKRVELLENSAPLQGGTADFSYIVDGEADFVELTVTDGQGNILYKEDGNTGIGPHNFTFDAANSETPIEDGTPVYLFVNAQDSDGETLDGLISAYANIDGVDGSGDSDLLTAGNLTYSLSDILRISSSE
jgi:flagellar basal-body rod modification protein FlgD